MTVSKMAVAWPAKLMYQVIWITFLSLHALLLLLHETVMKTCPCNIQRFFSAAKDDDFVGRFLIF